MRRFLFLLFAVLALGPPGWSQSTAKTFTFTGNNQNHCVTVTGLPTVGIQVTGTFTLTLTPEVAINGQSPQAAQVIPSNSSTAQSTITATGVYVAAVGGYDLFCLSTTAYTSGTATVQLNASPAVNASTLGGGGGGGNNTMLFQTWPTGVTSINAYGDSITAGSHVSYLTNQSWANMFSEALLGIPVANNYAVSGSEFGESGFTTAAYAATANTSVASIYLAGANEIQQSFTAAEVAAAMMNMNLWLSLPASLIKTHSSFTLTGTWSSNSHFGLADEVSDTVGSTATATVTGSTVYVSLVVNSDFGSQVFDVLVDGVSSSGGAGYVPGAPGSQNYPYTLRLPGYAAGSHTVEVSLIGPGTGFVVVQWMAGNGNGNEGTASAVVVTGGVMPISGVSSGTAATWNTAFQTVNTNLQSDGLRCYFINSYNSISLSADPPQYTDAALHPNVIGYALITANWIQFFSTAYTGNGVSPSALLALYVGGLLNQGQAVNATNVVPAYNSTTAQGALSIANPYLQIGIGLSTSGSIFIEPFNAPIPTCRPITAITLTAGTPVTICSWTIPTSASGLTFGWTCEVPYAISAGTLPTLTLGMNASQAPTNETGYASINSTNIGTSTQGTANASTTGNQNILTGASVSNGTYQARTWGTIQASATQGTFAITATLGGTGSPAGMIPLGVECILQ
jgi:hypothetical protein